MSGGTKSAGSDVPSLFPYHGDWAWVHFGGRRGERHVTTCYPMDVANTRTYTFNTLGSRGEEFDPNAARTVFASGGSTTVGVGVGDHDVWTQRFKQEYAALHRCDPSDVNVLNFAQGASGSDYAVRTLLSQCSRYKPGLVIAHLGGSNARTEWFDAEDHLTIGPWMVDPARPADTLEVAAAFYTYYTPELGALNALKNILLLQQFCRSAGIPVIIAWTDYTSTLEIAAGHPVCQGFVSLLDRRSLFEPRDAVDRVSEADHPGPLSHHLFATQLLDMCQVESLAIDDVLCRTAALELDDDGTAVLPLDRRFTLGSDLVRFVRAADGTRTIEELARKSLGVGSLPDIVRARLLDSLKCVIRFGILHFADPSRRVSKTRDAS